MSKRTQIGSVSAIFFMLSFMVSRGLWASDSTKAWDDYYRVLKDRPDLSSSERDRILRETVGRSQLEEDRARAEAAAHKQKEAAKKAYEKFEARRQKTREDAKKAGIQVPEPSGSPVRSAVSEATRTPRPASRSTGTDPTSTYRGLVEGGTVNEVIEFSGRGASPTPSPRSSESLRERIRREAEEKVRKKRR